jgi:hypothetical protein
MIRSLLVLILLTVFINFNGYSQCSAVIDAPSAAIANCVGPQITATATGPAPYLFNWSSPTITFSSTTIGNPTISSTTYGWQVINLIVIDDNGCTSIATDSVEFFPPVTTFNKIYCTLPDSICILDCPMTVQGWTYTDTLGNTSNLPLTDCVQITGPGDYELFGIYESNCTVIHTYHVVKDCGGGGCSATIDAPMLLLLQLQIVLVLKLQLPLPVQLLINTAGHHLPLHFHLQQLLTLTFHLLLTDGK